MKILCVDDEPLALQMLELSVKKARPEAEILTYRKPRELLEAARQNGCDIAFLKNGLHIVIIIKSRLHKKFRGNVAVIGLLCQPVANIEHLDGGV